MKQLLCCVFILLFLICACKEEKDDIPPNIVLISPFEGNSYEVLDQIVVEGSASDNELVKGIRISVLAEDGRTIVLPSISLSANQSNFSFKQNVVLSDSLLASGNYFIKVEADDGRNNYAVFRQIQIIGIAKRKLSLLVFTEDGINTKIHEDHNDLNFTEEYRFSNLYQSSVFNATDQQLWYFPKAASKFEVLQLNSGQKIYGETVVSSFNTPFVTSDLYDRTVFYGLKEKGLSGLGQIFNKRFNYLPENGRKVNALKAGEKYVVFEEEDFTGSNALIRAHFRLGSAYKSGISINGNTADFNFIDESLVIYALNQGNGSVLEELNIETSGKRRLQNFSDSIHSILKINKDEYLISTNQRVIRYNYRSNQAFDFVIQKNASMAYNSLNNRVYIGSGRLLTVYAYPSNALRNSVAFLDPIKGLHVRYNL